MNMVIYLDGGSQKQENSRKCVLSWGLVIHFQDTTVELLGAETDILSEYAGAHEHLAYLEAIKYAKSKGVQPENIAFVTDDSSVCDVNKWAREFGKIDPASKAVARLKALHAYLKDQCNFPDDLMVYAKSCLQYGKYQKVKGHARTIYNLRCDELAITARNWTKGNVTPILPFEEWLHDGHEYWVQREVDVRVAGPDPETPPTISKEVISVRKFWFAPFSDLHDLDITTP